MAAQAAVSYTYSCGGTPTVWDTTANPDNFPEHAALHAKIVELYREINALKDIYDRLGGWRGWWLRYRLIRYLRTRVEDFCQMCAKEPAPYTVCRECFWKAKSG